ncbi:hypothetical protein ES706_05763 [subsurface metagenome]
MNELDKTEKKEKLLTTTEVAERLGGFSAKTIQRWCDEGKIKVFKSLGGHRRIPESEIDRMRTLMEIVVKSNKMDISLQHAPQQSSKPREFSRQAILDRLSPPGLLERKFWSKLLSSAVAMKHFTPEELTDFAQVPFEVVNEFCGRMIENDFILVEDGKHTIKVEVKG